MMRQAERKKSLQKDTVVALKEYQLYHHAYTKPEKLDKSILQNSADYYQHDPKRR